MTNIDLPPHGGQLHRIAKSFRVPESELLDFSANINPEGPSASVIQSLQEALHDTTVLSRYPDLEETQLKLSISAYTGIGPESIIVANGFAPLLDAVLRALPIHQCLLPVPAFGEYRNALERVGVTVAPYLLDQERDFHYQPGELLRALTAGQHDAVLLANPQNPAGVLCDRDSLTRFIEDAAGLNVFVLLDEAFIDYAPLHSLIGETRSHANLIVFRSVTKFHGIPGLRVAYAAAEPAIAAKIHKRVPPWAISTLAGIAVRAALMDPAHTNRTLLLNNARREHLVAEIKALGFHTYPSAANYLLIRFQSIAEAAHYWEEMILKHRIVLRHCTTFEGLTHNHLRCAVLGDEQNCRLIQALGDENMAAQHINPRGFS